MLSEPRRNQLFVVVGVIVALCLATSAVCVAGQSVALRLPLPFGYLMSVCAVFRTTPALQFGFFWMSPFLSSVVPPFGGVQAGCFIVPWLPILPQRGEFVYPA
jgi:hypothetical protein